MIIIRKTVTQGVCDKFPGCVKGSGILTNWMSRHVGLSGNLVAPLDQSDRAPRSHVLTIYRNLLRLYELHATVNRLLTNRVILNTVLSVEAPRSGGVPGGRSPQAPTCPATGSARALSTWYVARTYNDRLATATLRRLGLEISYPQVRTPPSRRKRQGTLVPLNPGYTLINLEDVTSIELDFSEYSRTVSWQILQDIPGISYLFHDGENLLPLIQPPQWLIGDAEISEADLENLLRPGISCVQESPASGNLLRPYEFKAGDEVTVSVGALADFPARLDLAASGDLIAQYSLFGRLCSTRLVDCHDVALRAA